MTSFGNNDNAFITTVINKIIKRKLNETQNNFN